MWELQEGEVLMEDTILGPRKAMIESMEPGQGCRRQQRWLMAGAKFRAVFQV